MLSFFGLFGRRKPAPPPAPESSAPAAPVAAEAHALPSVTPQVGLLIPPSLDSTAGLIPGASSGLRWGAVSITGNFRENNEDRCFVDPQGRLFIVADGMGGQSYGEKASEMAVELIPQKLMQLVDFGRSTPEQIVEQIDAAVAYANAEILALSQLNPDYHNMGTTLAMILRVRDQFFVAGIGDSPIFRLRDGTLQKLTKDHSLTEALVEAGTITREEAAHHRYRNVLYRYLGSKEGGTGAKAVPTELRSGDKFFLCSDGAMDGVAPQTQINILQQNTDPQHAAQLIVQTAQAAGSKDNISCVTIYVD